ncbi:helix-turn-helix domain-containing protein [uncultured Winogradskyella sp.]|uniref:GlxA family transcriptional regulator n=1 Tax=uncultured Winogradskyella sp. TaxID=395353 RepID=UPI0026143DD4|nr:helix-turn-helix domain-containing protein [uncultured Winogradskyella sp.]
MRKLNNIVIAVPDADVVVSSISGSYKILSSIIQFTNSNTRLILAGSKKKQSIVGGLFSLHAQAKFHEIKKADLIIVPAIQSNIEKAIEDNQALCNWLVKQYNKGAYIASICSGAFLLGGAGLLNNKRCTTHWLQTQEFKRLFPKAKHRKHNIITEDQKIFTNGGAFSFLNLIIYLIDRFYGKEATQWAIGVFQINYNNNSQGQFVLFNAQKDHSDSNILKAQQYIEQNYMRKITNAEVAAHCNLGERTLVRRFKLSCGNTPNAYLQRVRIEKAKELLVSSSDSISAIQFDVGYNDPKTFRKLFLKYTSITPNAYRKQYVF